jgi:hypothetical protein
MLNFCSIFGGNTPLQEAMDYHVSSFRSEKDVDFSDYRSGLNGLRVSVSKLQGEEIYQKLLILLDQYLDHSYIKCDEGSWVSDCIGKTLSAYSYKTISSELIRPSLIVNEACHVIS